MSQQQPHGHNSSADPTPRSSDSPLAHPPGAQPTGEELSPPPRSPQPNASSSSEGYPSWLPRRPPPPAPQSTVHSTLPVMLTESSGPSAMEPFIGGRKPTPRSIRVVSLPESAPIEANPSRRTSGPAHMRVWSRATSAGLTATAFSSTPMPPHAPRPRFRSSTFHPELLRNPDWKMRIWFFLFPVFVFFHLPLQTFFDFNAVFMLLSVAKFPNPAAPGVPGSGRNWALGAAAYIACWSIQVFVIFLVYELVYSFIRRWRVKRPLMLPLYLSSPAFNFVAMTSYTNFCFMYYIRLSAFTSFTPSSTARTSADGKKRERDQSHAGSLRSGLAETFYFYSQNLPTVALLVPRAALSLALLLAYSGQGAAPLPAGDVGVVGRRDGTFFRDDGHLTGYARGILIANAAWTAWRILVLLISWFGLWLLSGHGFAGLCGPRYRWEEEDYSAAEKPMPSHVFSDNVSDHMDAPLPWTWREHTVYRVYDAWDFCLTNKLPLMREKKPENEEREGGGGFEGIEKVIAAVGLGGGPTPARRGVLSEDLFATPEPQEKDDVELQGAKDIPSIIPPPLPTHGARDKKSSVAGPSSPIGKLPYAFAGYPAQVSSEEAVVPFPPSPRRARETETAEGDDEEDDEEDEEEGEEEESEEEEEEEGVEGEEPTSGRRTSGSMSSLGRPVISRYPFQFRRPHQRGGSVSSTSQMGHHANYATPPSHRTHSSHPSQSSGASAFTQSTGNRETSSDSPYSVGASSGGQSPLSSFSGNAIPMPPRHPQSQARRSRAGTAPSLPSTPSPVAFPAGRPRARTRTESAATETSMTFGPGPIPLPAFTYSDEEGDDQPQHEEVLMDVPEAEGSLEEAEQRDSVGLLSRGVSPRGSLVNLRHLGSNLALPHYRLSNRSRSRSATSRSGSNNSRSRTNSGNSISSSARSRAQSLIQSLGAASRSSVDLVRSRANSMVRLSDSPYYSPSPDPLPSSPENHTFGHPLREQWRSAEQAVEERPGETEPEEIHVIIESVDPPLPSSRSGPRSASADRLDVVASATQIAEEELEAAHARDVTITPAASPSIPIPIPGRSTAHHQEHRAESQPDLSTAHQSFVTAPATLEGRTESSGQTPSSWGGVERYAEGHAWKPA